MPGHRKSLQLAIQHWYHELYSTSRGVVGPLYAGRKRRSTKRAARHMMRAWQKRQDRREALESHLD